MRAVVDLGPLHEMTAKALADLALVPAIMQSAADLGALYAQQHHAYRNRTGLLERNTKSGTVRVNSQQARVLMGAYRDYAQYVRGRGLMSIDDAANRVTQTITDAFERIGR